MSEADAQPRRSAGKWMVLLAVWAIGLIVWAAYVFAMIYVFFWMFGPEVRK